MPSTTTRRRFLAGVAASCTAVGAGTAVTGATRSTRLTPTTNTQQSALPETIRDAVERALDEYDADGATVSVVAHGETVLSEGFGHSYLNSDAPVEPDTTLFRIGSVSKVAPFVAAMRLVDTGDVDPHAPVDEVLDSVSIPDQDAYDEPITLAHLATHTTGFEQRYPGQVATTPDAIRPLPDVLEANDPDQIHEPGTVPLYTNYNAGLTGQLVADIVRTEFADAIEQVVFDPLGMNGSTFDPLPAELVGGRTDAASQVNWYSEMPPASGMSATATDMAALLHVLLGTGTGDTGQFLSAEAVEDLHKQWYTPHEQLAGISFGMERQRRDGTLVVGHQGGVPDFSTDLRYLPTEDVGLFVSVHGTEANDARSVISEAFLDHVAPVQAHEPSDGGQPTRADSVTGRYRSLHVTDTSSFEKTLYGITRPTTVVRIADDGTLVTDRRGETHRWIETDPFVFRRSDGADTLVFKPSAEGTTHLFQASDPWSPRAVVPWYEQGRIHGPLALLSGVLVLSGVVGWPLAAGWRRYQNAESPPQTLSRWRWVAGITAVLLFSFAVISLYGVTERWLYEPPPGFDLLFALPGIAAILSIATAGAVLRSWHHQQWSLSTRVHLTLVATGLVTLCSLCWYWNLLQIPL
ncbi:serine hydrolase domain-containing protein [Halopenitus sp. H-Gu1]|uniref:serine hydrolase domain-containing protein n=1 Tax=Halopenitus sp. H-Gu1 TaxID=3242697 RepID=UPI00359E6113